MSRESPPGATSTSDTVPTREEFLTALAAAIQRLLDDPALCRDPLIESLKSSGRRVDQPLVVAVGGLHGVGKSAMLNAILASGLLPESPLPTPGCRVVVRYGEAWSVEARYPGGTMQSIDVEWWHGTVAREELSVLSEAERLEVAVPYELLRSMVLVDTPGLCAPDARDARATEDAIAGAEALVWVTASDDPLPPVEQDALHRLGGHLSGRAVCVLTRVDALSDKQGEIAAAREHVAESLPGYFTAVAPIDAKAGRPEVATPVLAALRKGILAQRDTIKVLAAGEAARMAFIRRRAALVSDGALRQRVNAPSPRLHPGTVHPGGSERLDRVRRTLDALVGSHLGTVEKSWETAAAALRHAREEASVLVLSGVAEWTDYKPEKRTKQTLTGPELVTEWKRKVTWHWPAEHTEAAEKLLRDHAARPLTAFTDEASASAEHTMKEYGRMVLGAARGDTEALAADLLAGQADLFARYSAQHWRKLSAYYWGGMKSGGPKGLCGWMAVEKSRARPMATEADALVDAWLPMSRVLELGTRYLTEYRVQVDRCHAGWKTLCGRIMVGAEGGSTPEMPTPTPGTDTHGGDTEETLAFVARCLGLA